MLIINVFLFYSLFICLLAQQQSLFRLVLHPQDRGAACLDGSPPGLYINEGFGINKNKFMIYFDGGGFCGAETLSDTLQSCFQRSFTDLGSTLSYDPIRKFNDEGLLSPLKQVNPAFFDWTKIFVIYCDGSEYLGHRQNPIQYKGRNLFFRGTKNVMEQFRYLDEKYDFYNSETIVITGVSSGGLATFQWSNYLMENTKKAKILALPDSGFFITDYYSEIAQQKIIRTVATILLNLINDENFLPKPVKDCTQKPGLDLVDCLNSGNYIQFLKAPMLVIESAYDQYSISNILAVECLTNQQQPFSLQNCNGEQLNIIEKYRSASIQYFNLMKEKKSGLGIWSPSCVQHGFSDSSSFNNESYQVEGLKLSEAVQRFLQNPQRQIWLMDKEGWPSNKGCNGIENSLRQEFIR